MGRYFISRLFQRSFFVYTEIVINFLYMHSEDFIAEMKQKLEESKSKLQEELSGLPEHTEMGENEDDGLGELEVDEVNQDVRARIEQDLAKIDKALAKIEAGTYGTDDDGKEIDEDRLRVLPWADKAI